VINLLKKATVAVIVLAYVVGLVITIGFVLAYVVGLVITIGFVLVWLTTLV
jgi:hypothetical protein